MSLETNEEYKSINLFPEYMDQILPDINITGLSYLGNPNVKRAHVKWNVLSKEHEEEYMRCMIDPVYFIRKYMKIVHVDHGLVPFEMWQFQEEMIRSYHENRFNVSVLARQMGKSITTAGYILHYILFNETKDVAIIANKAATAIEILSRVQLAYEWLPKWLQQGVVTWNKGSMELENGCRIFAAATTGSSIRGKSISLLFLDEVAFIPDNVFNKFYESTYPTISSGQKTKVIMVSTPNGMNHFYEIVKKARAKESEFKIHEYTWRARPDRDEAWKATQIANTSVESFAQEYDCAFRGGTNTLLSGYALENLSIAIPIETREGGVLRVFERPKQGRIYMMSVDVSEGVLGDYSSIQVIDITNMPFKQVATYRNNRVSPLHLPGVIYNLGKEYNYAYALVEQNSIGLGVVNDLFHDLEYENTLFVRTEDENASKIGIKVNKRTKKVGCLRLKDMVESNALNVIEEETIKEFYRFAEKGDSFAAEEGAHDDMVMPLVNFAYYASLPYFIELTDVSFKEKFRESMELRIEEELPPMPFIDDGTDSNPFLDFSDFDIRGF